MEKQINSTDDTWSDYWINDSKHGEVFVNDKGRKHPVGSNLWANYFSGLRRGASLIDLACGAGSVVADLQNMHLDLVATDLSASALCLLQKRHPNVSVFASSAANIALPDACFDAAASQFGLEYAGEIAFVEAGRILHPDSGHFAALVHIRGGYVDKKIEAF